MTVAFPVLTNSSLYVDVADFYLIVESTSVGCRTVTITKAVLISTLFGQVANKNRAPQSSLKIVNIFITMRFFKDYLMGAI